VGRGLNKEYKPTERSKIMKKFKKTALKCSSGDELIECANRIAALGNIVYALAHDESEYLTWSGEALGGIISDLGKQIKSDLSALYAPIQTAYDSGDSAFIEELSVIMEKILKGAFTSDVAFRHAKDSIEKIDQFFGMDGRDILDIVVLREQFVGIEAKINKTKKEESWTDLN
jgi:hypothetical protein